MTRAEDFVSHLSALAGRHPADVFYQDLAGGTRINALIYPDVPERGMQVGVTYGLSLIDDPAWVHGRPELLIAVNSTDDRWTRAAGLLAANLAGQCTFSYGDVLDFGQPVTPDSAMHHFVVYAPVMLERADFLNVLRAPEGAPAADVINLQGLYPIHASEADAIAEGRMAELWKTGWDPHDVLREPAL